MLKSLRSRANAKLRKRLREQLRTDADFDAFVLDNLSEVHTRFSDGMERVQKENLLLQSADPAELAQLLGLEVERNSDPLFDRLLKSTELRAKKDQDEHASAELSLRLLDNQGFLRGLAEVSYPRHGRTLRHGVGLLTQPLDVDRFPALLAEIESQGLLSGSTEPTELVYFQWQPSPQLKTACAQQRIGLISLDEYEGLIDFSRLLTWQSAELARSIDYPPGLYVDQRLQYCEDASFRFDRHPPATSAVSKVQDWLSDPSNPRLILLIGDFGHGKTFLLREVCRRMGLAQGPIVPLFCELRDLEKHSSLEVLLTSYLVQQRHHLRRIDPDALLHMLTIGRVVLFFDGFDELALRTTYDHAGEHLNTLLQAVKAPGTKAKVVLTSRTQHFLSHIQLANNLQEAVRTVLGDRLRDVPVSIGQLMPFDRKQISEFLSRKLGDEAAAQTRLALIEDVKDLLGLSENPRLISFVAALPEADLQMAKANTGVLTAANLYQILLDRWMTIEGDRTNQSAIRAGLSIQGRYEVVTSLALRLWTQTQRTADIHDLEVAAQDFLQDLAKAALPQSSAPKPQNERGESTGPSTPLGRSSAQDDRNFAAKLSHAEAAHVMGSGTLLRRDAAGQFSFLHESVLEWLVAKAAATELKQKKRHRLLGHKEVSPLWAEFFHGHLGADAAYDWAESVLTSVDTNLGVSATILKHNARTVLTRLGRELPQAQNFASQDLHDRDFSGQKLAFTNFKGANLRGAKFYKTDLRRADFTDADLTGANLMGADLRGSAFVRTNLQHTKLIGAQLDPLALENLPPGRRAGAAWPGPTPLIPISREPATILPFHQVHSVGYSPDGSLLAVVTNSAITIYSADSGQTLRQLSGHGVMFHTACFSPDGKTFVSGSPDNTVRLWNVASGELEHSLSGHEKWITSVCFSPDGKILASGADDDTVRLWDVQGGQLEHRLTGHADRIRSVCFAPDGQTLASGSNDGTVRLWDAASGELKRCLSGHANWVLSVCFSPDGKTLACGSYDKSILLWDIHSGELVRSFFGHNDSVRSVCFSPDGKHLVSGSADKTAMLWDVNNGTQVLRLHGHENWVNWVCFSPDGKTIASGSRDHTVRLWDLVSGRCRATVLLAASGWAVYLLDGRYKFDGDLNGAFYHQIAECRFDPGELDEFVPGLRLADDQSLFDLPPWDPAKAMAQTHEVAPADTAPPEDATKTGNTAQPEDTATAMGQLIEQLGKLSPDERMKVQALLEQLRKPS